MPGLATHVFLNTFIGKISKSGRYLPFFIVGGVLPDVLTRVPSIFYEASHWYLVPFHTPFLLIFLYYLISLFFSEQYRRSIFFWSYGGAIAHFLPDALQKHIGFGYAWFFPFSWKSFTCGLFWPEDSLYVLPFLFLIFLVIFWFRKIYPKHSGQKSE